MRILIIILLLTFTTVLYADDFENQEDSYFSPPRTKIVWSMASGMGFGSANGFLGMNNGISGDVELFRIIGSIKPENIFFKYIWMTFNLNYNLYENEGAPNMYEVLSEHLIMGIGLKLSDEGFLKYFTPYLGAGAGYGAVFHRTGLDSDTPEMNINDGVFYAQAGGIEIKLINNLSFFIEEKYIWGTIIQDNNYIT